MRTYHVLNERPLQPWYSIDIKTEGDTKKVFFNSRIHVNKTKGFSFCFSTEFSDTDILKDSTLISAIFASYGKVTV